MGDSGERPLVLWDLWCEASNGRLLVGSLILDSDATFIDHFFDILASTYALSSSLPC